MRKIFIFYCFMLLFICLSTNSATAQTQWKTKDLGIKPNNYTVTLTLSENINTSSIDSSAIYAEDEWFESVQIQTSARGNKLYISPKTKYKDGATITIYVNTNLLSETNRALKKPTKIILHIDNQQQQFVPREDALNTINFSQPIYKVLTRQIVQADDALTTVTLTNVSENTLKNVVLFFPKTEALPFGAYRAITKITEQNGQLTLQLQQPNMQTFIDSIDISDEISIDASRFVVNPNLQNDGTVIVRNSSQPTKDLVASRLPLSNIKNLVKIEVSEDGLEANFNEFPIFDGAVALSGTFKTTNIEAKIDIERFTLNKIHLSYQEDIQLRTTLKTLGKKGLKEELYLGQIPIPYIGAKGVGFNAFVYLTIDIDGSSKVSITYSPTFNVAIDYPNDNNQHMTIQPDAGINKLSFDFDNKVKMSQAVAVGVGLLIGDHRLVELNGKIEASLSTEGKPFVDLEKYTNSKFCISNNINLSTNVNVEANILFASGRLTFLNRDFLKLSQGNCEFKTLELVGDNSNLIAGQSELFEPIGHLISTQQRITIPTPSSIVTFTSDNPYVTVSDTGVVKVSEDLPTKQKATITLTVRNPVNNEKKSIKKNITISPLSYFKQGVGYTPGAYLSKAFQPTLANWSNNASFNGPTKTGTSGQYFENANSLPVIDDNNILYVISNSGKGILAMTKSGSKIWETKFREDVGFPTLAENDTLYVASSNRVYALNINNGKTLWSTKLEGNIGNINITITKSYREHFITLQSDGTLLVPTPTKINAISKNGTLLWTKNVNGTYIKDIVVNVSSNGNLYYANAETLYGFNTHGGKLWERNFVNQGWNVESVQLSATGNPLICTTNGQLFEIGLKGETIKSITLPSCNTLAVSDTGVIYVATNNTVISLSKDFKRLKEYPFTNEYDSKYMTFDNLFIDAQQNIFVSGTSGTMPANTNPLYIVLNSNLKEITQLEDIVSGENSNMLIQKNAFYTINHEPNYGEPTLYRFSY